MTKRLQRYAYIYKYDDQRRKPLIAGLVTGVVEVRPARIIVLVLDRPRPVTERALAQVPANGPVHALHSNGVPPVTEMAAEDYNREGEVRAPPSVRSAPSAAL